MSLALRAARLVATLCLGVVGVLAVGLLLAPRLLGWQLETVLSGSMTPALGVGSVVAVAPVDPARVEVGDVVTFRAADRLVTHRVTEVRPGAELSFVTKGDANEEVDPAPVEQEALVGRVVLDVPHFGRLTQLLRDPLAFLLLAGVPGLLFVFLETRTMLLRFVDEEQPA